MMNLSNEHRFILSCIRDGVLDNKVENIACLHLDWEQVLDSAFWQCIAPLLYKKLSGLKEKIIIPPRISDRLKEAYYANLARNMYLFGELKKILMAFDKTGTEVMVLKGAALANTVYDDIGLRPMGDVDLLIKRDDLSEAERILGGSGYLFKGNRNPQWCRKNNYHIAYGHPETNVMIELHWGIASEVNPEHIRIMDPGLMNRWRERARTVDISGRKSLILSPEDLLFYLCMHFFKHRFYGSRNGGFTSKGSLMQLYDIYKTLTHYNNEINWDVIHGEARKYGLEGLIFSTFHLVQQIMDCEDHICQSTCEYYSLDQLDKRLIKLVKKKIFIRENELPNVPGGIIQSFRQGTFHSGMRNIFRDIFPSQENMSKKYMVPVSSRKLYFCYAMRPFDVLIRHRRIVSEIFRIRDDAILNRWIYSQPKISTSDDRVDPP